MQQSILRPLDVRLRPASASCSLGIAGYYCRLPDAASTLEGRTRQARREIRQLATAYDIRPPVGNQTNHLEPDYRGAEFARGRRRAYNNRVEAILSLRTSSHSNRRTAA